jgi:tRNA pseudouridine55 synthase
MIPCHGLLVLDKPGGITSRDAVNRAQQWFRHGTRLGHTGTLDPLATGVLVLCVGLATRLTEYVQRMAKTYRTGILLGARSATDDADSAIVPVSGAKAPQQEELESALRAFVGDIEQVPPAFSAAKLTGRRAYDLARAGKQVDLGPRRVQIFSIDVLGYAYPRLELEVRCGKGTYIRSLARDLGERLGCGALVETLRRTRVGPFEASAGICLDAEPAAARAHLLPVAAAVAELPALHVSADLARRLSQGQGIAIEQFTLPAGCSELAVFGPGGSLFAVARADWGRGLLLPEKVLGAPG